MCPAKISLRTRAQSAAKTHETVLTFTLKWVFDRLISACFRFFMRRLILYLNCRGRQISQKTRKDQNNHKTYTNMSESFFLCSTNKHSATAQNSFVLSRDCARSLEIRWLVGWCWQKAEMCVILQVHYNTREKDLVKYNSHPIARLPITRMRNRSQYRFQWIYFLWNVFM